MAKATLQAASKSQMDEFYTRLSDIESEIRYYRDFFRGKTVLCNCDDCRVSNFSVYFVLNFEALGLKRLSTTCYKNNQPDLFSNNDCERAVYAIYDGDPKCQTIEDARKIRYQEFEHSNGDFRSPECVALLREADVVVTNPPFSLWREYVALLMKYEKKFLILGNTNAATYKEIFPYIKENKLWVGVTNYNVGMFFGMPDYAEKYHHIDENGHKIGRVSTACWWTNIDNKRRNEEVVLFKTYSPEVYPKYDNYDAIECSNYVDIPMDYDGVIGVPITFLGHYNPKQFEIVGQMANTHVDKNNHGYPFINGVRKYARLLIRRIR